jgi:phosphatidylglycerophosphate synthase
MWNDVVAIYRASKKRKDINWWTEWVCRPPAAVVVYFLRNTAVTPNQVTFLSALVAAGSGLMFALLPGHLWLVLAALVFEFSFVLDCADGQLARLRRIASPLGHMLDFLMDELKAMFLFACIAYRLWHGSGDELYLVAGLGGLFALASGLTLTSFMRRPEYGAPPPTSEGQPAVMKRRRGPIGLAVSALEHGARTVVHYPSYIWLVALAGRIDIYFWAYAAVNVLYLARCLLSILVKLGRFAAAPSPAPAPIGEELAP